MYSLEPFTGPLGEKNASHLLRRATFGPTRQNILDMAQMTADEAVDLLFQDMAEPLAPIDPLTGEDWVSPKPGPENSPESELIKYFMAWQMELMRKEPYSIREKMTWFLHTHLPVAFTKVQISTPIYYQNKLYRHFAFGNFKTLFKKVVIDNAMLWYLDNTLNQAGDPNENFAREMLELYTIGKGPQIDQGDYTNYTEDDIKAAARVLTGYLVDFDFETFDQELLGETQIAQGYLYTENNLALIHDAGVKQFSDKFQNRVIEPAEIVAGYATKESALQELDEMIEMIFEQEATAKFLVRKLYRFFVYYKITDQIEEEIITPLADTFRDSNYSFEVVMKQLLKSKHFYDADSTETGDDHIGAIIKSPLDLMIHVFKFFQLEFPENTEQLYHDLYGELLLDYYYIMGMPLYNPDDVAGYPAYFQEPGYNRNWITSSNLAFRYYPVYALIIGLYNEENVPLMVLDIVAWVDNPENIPFPGDAVSLVRDFTTGLFATPLSEERLTYFVENIFMDGLPLYDWTTEWVKYKDGGSDEIIRQLLHRLLVGLMQSPEFQLF